MPTYPRKHSDATQITEEILKALPPENNHRLAFSRNFHSLGPFLASIWRVSGNMQDIRHP